MRHKLILERKNCIGCNACVVASKSFDMSPMGKSYLKERGIPKSETGEEVQEIFLEEDFESSCSAAESCPTSCIHVSVKKKSKKGEEFEEKII